MTDKKLGNPPGSGEFQDRGRRIFTFQDLDVGAGSTHDLQALIEGSPIRGGDIRLIYVRGYEIGVKSRRDNARGLQHVLYVRSRGYAHKNALVSAEVLPDPMLLQVLLELEIHYLGREHQSKFPQFRELLLSFLDVGLLFSLPSRFLGRRIDELDFIGALDE